MQRKTARADAIDHDSLHESIGGVFAWGPDRQELSAGNALLELGQLHSDPRIIGKAARYSGRALQLFQSAPRSSTIETSARVDLATALLLAGELDGARESLEPIFVLPGDRRTSRFLARLEQVCAQLDNPRFDGSPRTRELRADLREYGKVSALQALPRER
jgi:phage gp46-like protein